MASLGAIWEYSELGGWIAELRDVERRLRAEGFQQGDDLGVGGDLGGFGPVAVLHDPSQGGADQELGDLGVGVEQGEDVWSCAAPDQGVDGDDGQGEGGGAPVEGEVDDGGWGRVGEQDVAGEVAVDQLAWQAEGSEQGGKPAERGLRLGRADEGRFLPGRAVGDGPAVCLCGEEGRAGEAAGRGVEGSGGRDDLGPAAGRGLAVQALLSPPAVNDPGAVAGGQGLGDAEADLRDLVVDGRLPDDLWREGRGFEDQVAGSVGLALTAGQADGRLKGAERGEDLRWRRDRVGHASSTMPRAI